MVGITDKRRFVKIEEKKATTRYKADCDISHTVWRSGRLNVHGDELVVARGTNRGTTGYFMALEVEADKTETISWDGYKSYFPRYFWPDEFPEGTVPGGFVPYMYINAKVTNENTGLSTFIDLVPHINLIDNFHYARNISLPGSTSDLYTVKFNVIPPTSQDMSLHKDWLDNYGNQLFEQTSFTYKKVNFKEIAESTRR